MSLTAITQSPDQALPMAWHLLQLASLLYFLSWASSSPYATSLQKVCHTFPVLEGACVPAHFMVRVRLAPAVESSSSWQTAGTFMC